jgi:hypothetical protein
MTIDRWIEYSKMDEALLAYVELLKKHDRTYTQSEDFGVYCKGWRESQEILTRREELVASGFDREFLSKVYKEHCK